MLVTRLAGVLQYCGLFVIGWNNRKKKIKYRRAMVVYIFILFDKHPNYECAGKKIKKTHISLIKVFTCVLPSWNSTAKQKNGTGVWLNVVSVLSLVGKVICCEVRTNKIVFMCVYLSFDKLTITQRMGLHKNTENAYCFGQRVYGRLTSVEQHV